jgi:hemerythrin superfamily protein
MTFACKVRTLNEDYKIWKKYCGISKTPKDFLAFTTLTLNNLAEMISLFPRFKRRKGEIKILFKNFIQQRKMKRLVSVIPAYSTHTDIKCIAPCINWENIQ